MSRENNKITDYLLVALAPLCWAGDVVLAKGVVGLIPPYSLAFWRWFVAFLFLLPFTWPYVKKDLPEAKQSWKMIGLLSFLGVSVFISLIYTAVHTTTAINVALIQTTMPVAIAINCYILYREKISISQVLCLCGCFMGVCFVVLRGRISNVLGMSFALGDVLMLIATMMYGLYSALMQRKAPKLHMLSLLTIFAGAGALALLPLYLLEIVYKGGFVISIITVSRIFYAAVFPSILAYFCWIRGVSTIGANKTGMFINLLPVFASILAVAFLGESFRWFHLVGMVVIVSGMLAFNKLGKSSIDRK